MIEMNILEILVGRIFIYSENWISEIYSTIFEVTWRYRKDTSTKVL